MLSKKVKRVLRPRLLSATIGAVAVLLLMIIYFTQSQNEFAKKRCGAMEAKSPHWLVQELNQPISETHTWKTILLWTDRLACGNKDDLRGVEAFRGCEVNKCFMTADKDDAEFANAVVFGTVDFDEKDLPRPSYRQYNVYYDPDPLQQADLTSDFPFGFFDIAISTRTTSDVVFSQSSISKRSAHRAGIVSAASGRNHTARADPWCGLCQKLHDSGFKPHPYLDVHEWLKAKPACQLPSGNCSRSHKPATANSFKRPMWFRDAGRTVRPPWKIDWGKTFFEWFRYYRQ